MLTMYLYRLGEYIPVSTIPTLPMVSFKDPIDLSRVPTYPMDEMEQIWKEENQIVFVLHYLEGNDVYYFLLPDDHENTCDYWHHETENQNLKWHHCDFYANRILERFLNRFERRIHTRSYLSEIYQQIQDKLHTTDETDMQFQEELYERLRAIIYTDESHDRHLIQRVREEAWEKVETERRFRPDGEGFLEAQQHFDDQIKSLPL